ncbi:uncharacterized protein PGTG_07261 [Puccinia graminis f. sp. tritici CRL 75-36-700-3]|uniref:Uncharacterized protein n=1 Tax=Puccinia graminis f. sp. tritici (strain CRL 75-36-700-3 / race SCCL) TaxID=418459 RepID=E3KA27_PUCGT|nr:uncharacterized protein PGTG_07261 [Puccinia graminis f. sp. tritici CRL 75-36-700-3]EFP81009.2 hypothetical protein PGTG_07261 [Puccinia graminis f. sp. tritici CRL 75-36-700-3]
MLHLPKILFLRPGATRTRGCFRDRWHLAKTAVLPTGGPSRKGLLLRPDSGGTSRKSFFLQLDASRERASFRDRWVALQPGPPRERGSFGDLGHLPQQALLATGGTSPASQSAKRASFWRGAPFM